MTSELICGWREWVRLPGLGITSIKAKVDTGARTSAIHTAELEEFQRAGSPWIRFIVQPRQRSTREASVCEAPLIDRRSVRNSGGRAERRYVIETDLALGGQQWPIELTLTSRDKMGFRMLLGRTALRKRMLVDPGRSYLLGSEPT